MSLSTSIASSRGGGPRKQYTASITAPSPKPHSGSASTGSGSRKQQSSNSEEEIAQRQHKNRQSTAETPCCLISFLCCSFPVWASTLLVSVSVCLFLLQDMAAT